MARTGMSAPKAGWNGGQRPRRWTWVVAVGLLLFSASCATAPKPEVQRLVWPPPPVTARIEFVRTVVSDENLGKESLAELMYRTHPYGRLTLGRVSDLKTLSLDDLKAYVAQHPEMSTALYHVPKYKGVIGTAANFAIHVAEKMGTQVPYHVVAH